MGEDIASTKLSELNDIIVNMVKLLKLLSQESIHVRIILALARKGHLSLRGVAREVGMAPKNVKRYLENLESLGIVKCVRPSKKMFLYRLSDEYAWLRDLISETDKFQTNSNHYEY